MKKRRRTEERRKRKEAYYNELRKQNVLNNSKETFVEKHDELSDLTKTQLIEKLKELGVEATSRMTKAELLNLFPKEEKTEETTKEIVKSDETEEVIEIIEPDEVETKKEPDISENTTDKSTLQEIKQFEPSEQIEEIEV